MDEFLNKHIKVLKALCIGMIIVFIGFIFYVVMRAG